MYQVIKDEEKKYMDEILFHLRSHNNGITGDKIKETKYIYVKQNEDLLGALTVNYSWDWASIGDIFYKDTLVLQELISKACELYKDEVGLKFFTTVEERRNDFLQAGFKEIHVGEGTPQSGKTYYLDISPLNYRVDYVHQIIVTDEVIKSHNEVLENEVKVFNQANNITDMIKEYSYVLLDEKTFAGGIHVQLYDDSLHVNLLVVNKEYRGNDLGTKLMDLAEKDARELGLYQLDLGTTSFQARPFYEKQGYHVTFTRKNFPKGFECYSLVKKL